MPWLTRQTNVSSEAPSGDAAISVVEPPPFFHGVVRQSPARMIRMPVLVSHDSSQGSAGRARSAARNRFARS